MDISRFMSWFLGQMVGLVGWTFDILDSITFNGISILDFLIGVLLLSVIIPILITLVKSRRTPNSRESSKASSKEDSKEE